MRKGGSKSKGGSYERHICRTLSLWMSNGFNEDLWWRSAMSGGRATIKAKTNVFLAAQAGDITSIHPMSQPWAERYYFELKHRRDLKSEFYRSVKNDSLQAFWAVAKVEAQRYGKEPIIICRQNNAKDWFVVASPLHKRISANRACPIALSIFPLYDMQVYDFASVLAYFNTDDKRQKTFLP